MSKPLVIYHAEYADGFGAAFAAWLSLGDEADYRACQYGREEFQDGETVSNRDVYILDFSFPRDIMDWLFRDAKHVVWLDHHFTSKSDAEDFCPPQPYPVESHQERHDIIHDMSRSGAMLAWEYFHPGTEVPMFIKHIDDYDRWQFKIEGTKALNKYLWSCVPWSFHQWKIWCNAIHSNDHVYFREGEAILRAHDQNVQSVVKGSARRCGINWVPAGETGLYDPDFAAGLAANCPPHLTSDVGHELANQSSTFGLCWTLSQTGLVAKCSLRSNGDYDVSAIAKSFGGGGHRNAAGFEVDIKTLLRWLK